MQVHAYPTDATVPVQLPEAERIAASHLSDPGDAAGGVEHVVTEFDSCFTVVAIVRSTADQTIAPPLTPVSVIDKATGAVSYWPSYPVTVVAERYGAALADNGLIVEDEWPGAAGG
ncbi:hypothetical protein [Nocardia sp. XZ_19_385]|uniref:hypothetical protein n=1 Tax=Nocardia sp. XZ_19_385 TaxID=2769488 RepID=UPI0018900489|nr:hypothetical protein [Nocardia sp. XZ_19_385]